MIKDMIDSIEQFAQTQADFPVYDCLGNAELTDNSKEILIALLHL